MQNNYTAKQIARLYGRTTMTVSRWVERGLEYETIRPPKRKQEKRFTIENVDKFLKTSKYELKGLKK